MNQPSTLIHKAKNRQESAPIWRFDLKAIQPSGNGFAWLKGGIF
jgi:hypothetical protein